MSDYTPQRGDHLVRYGEEIRIFLVTKTRVIFSLYNLGENKGTHYEDRATFLATVQTAQPQFTLTHTEAAA